MLTLFLTPAQEPVSSTSAPPLEVLEVEVFPYEFKPQSVRGPQVSAPPGPVDARDITGVRGSTANREPQTIEDRSRELRDIGKGSAPQGGIRRSTGGYSYVYRASVKNISMEKIKSILWEYQLLDSSGTEILAQRLFVCAMTVKPGNVKLLSAGTASPPSRVVSADASDDKPQKQRVVINRVEYADGSTWTREGWKPDDLTRADAGKDLRDGQCRAL
jgi:hypothetical protein